MLKVLKMITDVDDWKVELLFSGRIVQDGDETVSPDEAERRFNRYIKLVEMVEGDEGQNVFQALVDSIQADEDYGAYQATMGAAEKFPEPKYAQYLIEALPALIKCQPDWAGNFMVSIANQVEFGDEARIHSFNRGF